MPVATPDKLKIKPTSAMVLSGAVEMVAVAGVFVMRQVYDWPVKRRTPAISDGRSAITNCWNYLMAGVIVATEESAAMATTCRMMMRTVMPTATKPIQMPARARPRPFSPVFLIWFRATKPRMIPRTLTKNDEIRAAIAMPLVF